MKKIIFQINYEKPKLYKKIEKKILKLKFQI